MWATLSAVSEITPVVALEGCGDDSDVDGAKPIELVVRETKLLINY